MPPISDEMRAGISGGAVFRGQLSLMSTIRNDLARHFKQGTVGTYVASAVNSLRKSKGMLWPELVELLQIAEEKTDWSKPVWMGIDQPERTFGDFTTFYAEMVEPWLGEWRKLTEHYRHYVAGEATREKVASFLPMAVDNTIQTINPATGTIPKVHAGRPKVMEGEVENWGAENIAPQLSYRQRAKKNQISDWTQKRLDALANAGRVDLLERVKAEKISVRGAMVEAGLASKPDQLKPLRRAWEKADEATRQAFLHEVGAQLLS